MRTIMSFSTLRCCSIDEVVEVDRLARDLRREEQVDVLGIDRERFAKRLREALGGGKPNP
jgi:hypothetical protein